MQNSSESPMDVRANKGIKSALAHQLRKEAVTRLICESSSFAFDQSVLAECGIINEYRLQRHFKFSTWWLTL